MGNISAQRKKNFADFIPSDRSIKISINIVFLYHFSLLFCCIFVKSLVRVIVGFYIAFVLWISCTKDNVENKKKIVNNSLLLLSDCDKHLFFSLTQKLSASPPLKSINTNRFSFE